MEAAGAAGSREAGGLAPGATRGAARAGLTKALPAAAWAGLVCVLAFALVIRVRFAVGYTPGDVARYFDAALEMGAGRHQLEPNAYSVRLGLIAPVALLIRLFGVGDGAVVTLPLFASLAGIWLCYLVGTQVGASREAGLLSAFLLASLPLDVLQAGDLHADLPMSMWLGACLWCGLTAASAASPREARFRHLLCGLAFGCAYVTKLTALAFLPALLALVSPFRYRSPGRAALLSAASFLLAETLAYWLLLGDPFHRIRGELAMGGHAEQVRMLYPDAATNLRLAFLEVPTLLLKPFPAAYHPDFGYHFLLVPLALFFAVRQGSVPMRRLLWWFALVYLPLSFGTLDFRSFTPAQIRWERTLEPLCLPGMVILGCYLVRWSATRLAALLVPLTLCSIVFVQIVRFDLAETMEPLRMAYASALAHRDHSLPVFSDPFTVPAIRFLDAYRTPDRIRVMPPRPSHGYVVVNPAAEMAARRWAGYIPPAWISTGWSAAPLVAVPAYERVVGGHLARLAQRGPAAALFWVQPRPGSDVAVYLIGATP